MLESLFKKYNSDKGSKHHYHLVYDNDFKELRNKKINFLEIGILGGASLKTWLEYFPNASIYAIDIISKDSVEILNNQRITYLQHDSTDDKIIDEIEKWGVNFDIIIEDGLHTPTANKKTFENLYRFLNIDGNYYIEDFFPIHLMNKDDYKTKSGQWVKENENWSVEQVNSFISFISNFNYETFDNRKLTSEQDSFIFKIKKS